ncbi:unnamed protein product [Prorocentrum cordatum]|uniref:Uncharacterized protein n=1 Tax=Prorocentrum cordatum TaxID=2364126 RepID=A0ABN9SY27_9DINO|nr:unnamed protein product [Polarella glacialis]
MPSSPYPAPVAPPAAPVSVSGQAASSCSSSSRRSETALARKPRAREEQCSVMWSTARVHPRRSAATLPPCARIPIFGPHCFTGAVSLEPCVERLGSAVGHLEAVTGVSG